MSQQSTPLVSETWFWPDSLDALVAAPAHHQLLLENERARVLYTRIPRGDLVPLHTHRWRSVLYVLGWSDFVRRDHEGDVLMDSRKSGSPPKVPSVQWQEPLPPHTLENVGQSEILLLVVELKEADR